MPKSDPDYMVTEGSCANQAKSRREDAKIPIHSGSVHGQSPLVQRECPGVQVVVDREGMLVSIGTSPNLPFINEKSQGSNWTTLIHADEQASCVAAMERLGSGETAEESVLARTVDRYGTFVWKRWHLRAQSDRSLLGWILDAEQEHSVFEQYRLGIEASPTGLLMVGTDGAICLVNRQVETMFGYARAELLGEPIEVLVPERYRSQHPHKRTHYHSAPTTRFMGQGRDLYGVRQDGTEFAIEIGLNPLTTDHGTRVLASIVDVTSRKAQESELRAHVADLQRYRGEMNLLSEMSSLLQHALDENEAHRIVKGFGESLLPSLDVAIYSLRSSRDVLELTCHWGVETPAKSLSPPECWALRRSQVHRTYHLDIVPHFSPQCSHRPSGSGSFAQLCIPMSAHGQSIGVVVIASSTKVDETERDNLERVAKAIADQLALALSNIQLRYSLRSLAIRDSLTGLFNRRYLEETVDRELSRAKRNGTAVAVWMIDIDHFKQFNDTHGHQSGDEALVAFSERLNWIIRPEDIPCRFGGEEFVVVLPSCDREVALARANEFRKEIGTSNIGITLSIGVSEWPKDGKNWDEVLRCADAALYAAKDGGRNRVVSSTND